MLKYLSLWFYLSKEIFYYSYILLITNIRVLLFVFVLSFLWIYWATNKWISDVGGISLSLYAWYIFFTEVIMINWIDRDLIRDVKSGEIITFLNKPLNYVRFYLSHSFFKNLIKIWVTSLVSGIIIFIFVQKFPFFGIIELLLAFLSLLIGVFLLAIFQLMLGLFSFIFEDSSFLNFLVNKMYFILWGVLFPISIYPLWLQEITKFFPFRYYVYSPAKFFTTWDLEFFANYFPLQLFWFGITLFLVFFIYWKVVKRLEINGG